MTTTPPPSKRAQTPKRLAQRSSPWVPAVLGTWALGLLGDVANTYANSWEAPPSAVEGAPLSLTFHTDSELASGVQARATYAPQSAVARTEVIGVTDHAGTLRWTPSHAGLVLVEGGGASITVAVRYASPPTSGVAIFAVAALALFGGATLGIRMLLRQPAANPPPDATT